MSDDFDSSAIRLNFNTSNLSAVLQRPYMIESAFDYYTVAIESRHQRMDIQVVMSALAIEIEIEILLKSFNAKITANQGKINEKYESEKTTHDLIRLYNSIPSDIKSYLFDNKLDLETLNKNKDLFTKSRYSYEKNANIVHSDCMIKLAAQLICKIVYLYRKQGCKDSFIQNIDINRLYTQRVKKLLILQNH